MKFISSRFHEPFTVPPEADSRGSLYEHKDTLSSTQGKQYSLSEVQTVRLDGCVREHAVHRLIS